MSDSRMIKNILIVFSVIYHFMGVVGVAGGIWLSVRPTFLFTFLKTTYEDTAFIIDNSAYLLIGLSVTLIIVSIFGFFGIWFDVVWAMKTFTVLMVLLAAVEMTLVGLVVLFDVRFRMSHKENVAEVFVAKYFAENPDPNFIQSVNEIQTTYSCCGVQGRRDYTSVDGTPIPKSCADNHIGCNDAMTKWIEKNIALVVGFASSMIFLQIALVTMSIMICVAHPAKIDFKY